LVPIDIELESPGGTIIDTLGDIGNVLHRTLPYYDDATLRLLNKVDWYGETEFEPAQMAVLLEELDRIIPRAADAEEVSFLRKLKQLLIRCGATPGSKLKFIGD
jgi:hypothetical protein